MGAYEDAGQRLRYPLHLSEAPRLGDLFDEAVVGKAVPGGALEKIGVDLEQPLPVQHPSLVGDREQRLDAARTLGDDAYRAGRGDGGGGRVPERLAPVLRVDALVEVGERPVSYTHLTLPTIYPVYISVVAVS